MTATMERIEELRGVGGIDVVEEVLADPASLPTDRLEYQIVSQAGHLSAAMCRWLLLVAEYDRREAYLDWQCRSMAHWLEWKCQLAAGTAREHVRVARAITALPLVADAFGRGEISYSKARALTRAATPDTEADLVEMAREMTGSQLDRAMRTLEKAARQITVEDLYATHAKRSLERFEDDDGDPYWILRPGPEEDAMLTKAIEYARDADWAAAKAEAKAAGEPRVSGRRGGKLARIDALMRLVEWGATRATEYDDAELPSERYQVVVHVNANPAVGGDGLIHLEGGIRLHPRTAQRLGCNATVRLVDGDGNELNKGRRMRTFTRRQKRRLADKYPTCAFPHCDIPARWSDAHHYISWIDGGLTDIDNGIYLCRTHHHAVHEGGWRIFTDAAGMIIAVGPDGRRVTRSALTHPPAPGFTLPDLHHRLGLPVDPPMEPPYERADMRYVIDSLIQSFETDYRNKKRAAEEAAAAIPGGPPDGAGTATEASEAEGPPQQPLLN